MNWTSDDRVEKKEKAKSSRHLAEPFLLDATFVVEDSLCAEQHEQEGRALGSAVIGSPPAKLPTRCVRSPGIGPDAHDRLELKCPVALPVILPWCWSPLGVCTIHALLDRRPKTSRV